MPNLAVVVDSGIIHRDWSQLKRLRYDDRFAKGPGLRERPTSEPAFGSIELGYWRVRGACSGRQRTQYSSPAFYFGKGFGDLPGYLGWLRPFAVTDEFALEIRNRYPDPPVAELLRYLIDSAPPDFYHEVEELVLLQREPTTMISRIAIMLVVMFAVVGNSPAQMPSNSAQPKLPITLIPDPHRCSDLVELEQLPYDAQNDTMSFPIDPRGIDLLLGYYAIEGCGDISLALISRRIPGREAI